MNSHRFSNPGDEALTIDPSLLLRKPNDNLDGIDPSLISVGGGVNDPNYNANANANANAVNDDEDFMLDHGTTAVTEGTLTSGPTSPAFEYGTIEERGEPFPTLDMLDRADTQQLGPTRPRLTLETSLVAPEPSTGRTPTTPEIRVSRPGNTSQEIPTLSQALGAGRARTRRASSPGRPRWRGNSRTRLGRWPSLSQTRGAPYLSPTSSPMTPRDFIEQPYNVGDRTLHQMHATPPHEPTSAPAAPPSISPSSLPSPFHQRVSTPGYHVCLNPECAGIKAFETPNELKKHQRKHMPEEERPHPCGYDKCPRRFLYPKDRNRHEDTHVQVKEQCPLCGHLLSRKDNVRRHMQKVHGEPPATPSSSGRGRRHMNAASPSIESFASFSAYSGSRPGTPAMFSETAQLFPQDDFAHLTGAPLFENDLLDPTTSPVFAPPMMRSRSDVN